MRNANKKAPQLTRRHYVFIANAIKTAKLTKPQRRKLADHFAGLLTVTNPRFNLPRFIEAATRSN